MRRFRTVKDRAKTVPSIMEEVEARRHEPPTKERPVGIDRGMKVPDSFLEPLPNDVLRAFGVDNESS